MKRLLLNAVLVCQLFTMAWAVKIDMPATIPGAETINAERLVKLAGSEPGFVLIDARITADRTHGFIEESISLPDIDTNCESLEKLVPQKDKAVIFYCNGVRCGRSVKSVKIATSCGYKKLYWFRGGFEEWKEKGYPFIKY